MTGTVIRARAGTGAEEIARGLLRRLPSLACPACGGRDFGLLEQPALGYRSVLTRQQEAVSRSGGNELNTDELLDHLRRQVDHAVATLVCTACGRVQQFSDAALSGAASAADWGQPVSIETPAGEDAA